MGAGAIEGIDRLKAGATVPRPAIVAIDEEAGSARSPNDLLRVKRRADSQTSGGKTETAKVNGAKACFRHGFVFRWRHPRARI